MKVQIQSTQLAITLSTVTKHFLHALFPSYTNPVRATNSTTVITETVAETLVTLWYGTALASKYLKDPSEVTNLMSNFLAACICQTGFPPEKLLQFCDEVPNELEDIYVQILRYVKSCSTTQHTKAPEDT